MKSFFGAVQFLTIFPLPAKGRIDTQDFGKALFYFPLVGLILGCILAAVSVYSFHIFSPLVMAALLILVSTVLTGGLHLDGFADTCDGLYGFHSPEKRLEIMRDSRTGVMGVAGLVCLLLLKFSLLTHIPLSSLWKTLVMMAVISRWSMVIACYGSAYPRQEGKARLFIEQARLHHLLAGGMLTFFLFLFLAPGKGLIIFFGTLITVSLFILYIRKKIGGMTGDTIGATNEIAEVSALLLANFIFR